MRRVLWAAILACALAGECLNGECLAAEAAASNSSAGDTPGGARAKRHPAPDLASQAKAERLILELFGTEYRSNESSHRQRLAKKLLEQGLESGDSPTAQFVLLREARDVAASVEDMTTACRAHDTIVAGFDMDGDRLTLAMLASAGSWAKTQAGHLGVAAAAMRYADAAAMRGEFGAAARLMAIAQAQAGLSKNVAMSGKATARANEIANLVKDEEALEKARRALEKNREDGEANLLVGRHLCFGRGDFAGGLEYLAKGSESTLARLAADELANPVDARQRFEIGDRWWILAEKQGPLAQRHVRRRAAQHFQAALPLLTGLSRSVAEQRLEAVETLRLEEMNLARGLVAELFKGISFAESVGKRIDAQVNFEWGEGAADEGLPKDDFSIRWSGQLRVESEGRHELVVQANTGVRIWIDGKVVMDQPNLTRLRNGARAPVDLSPGMHPIRIEFWDTGGLARMKLMWQPPGAAAAEAVPARAFYHDVLSSPGASESSGS